MTPAISKPTIVMAVGGMWESAEWHVAYDHPVTEFGGCVPCPHCHSDRQVSHTTAHGGRYVRREWVCPRVVIAENECGNNTTGVCLDCILEAAPTL